VIAVSSVIVVLGVLGACSAYAQGLSLARTGVAFTAHLGLLWWGSLTLGGLPSQWTSIVSSAPAIATAILVFVFGLSFVAQHLRRRGGSGTGSGH
jgi:hypothetical protein